MKTLIFVTSNQARATSLRKVFEEVGLNITVETKDIPLVEPQADTCEAIAVSKAMQAYEQLHSPLIVDDSSFHIEAFKGFPGPYAKYVIGKLGADGFISIMKGKKNRAAYFDGVLVYMDEMGKHHVFGEEPYTGTITGRVYAMEDQRAWSELDKIFIPSGSDRVLGEMSHSERAESKGNNGKYRALADWLLQGETV